MSYLVLINHANSRTMKFPTSLCFTFYWQLLRNSIYSINIRLSVRFKIRDQAFFNTFYASELLEISFNFQI